MTRVETVIAWGASALAACAFSVACTHDFDQFAPVAADGSVPPDAAGDAPSPFDVAVPDAATDAGSEAGRPESGCTPPASCFTSAASCVAPCISTSASCIQGCGASNGCKQQCKNRELACRQSCQTTCDLCTQNAGCADPSDCADAALSD